MEQKQSSFEGWAVVELFGHNQEAGHVTTEGFGTAVLFRVEVPALPADESVLEEERFIRGEFCRRGTKVSRAEIPARTRFIGPGGIYAINPCSKEEVMKWVEDRHSGDLMVLERPPQPEDEAPEEIPL